MSMKLFEPCNIGKMILKNRIVMAPMSCNLTENGFVTEVMVRFFEERAKGGVGLVTIGDGIVDSPIGNNVRECTAIDDDRYIPPLKKLTQAVKEHGAKIVMQLSHAGRRAGRVSEAGYLDVTKGKIPVAPSALPHPVPGHVVPRELTREEIRHIVVKFGRAACRSIAAGFDGIGLHCAHMYLCGQFLSPWANRREDEYGRGFEGRMRFVLEVVHRIKKETGVAYPLIVRMNGEEQSGGNSLEEIQEIARQLENAGVDAIHVSAGFGTPTKVRGLIPSVTPMRAQAGCIVHLAENIKKVVSIPVIAVNKLGSFFVAEKVLQEGKADLIGIGRSLIADPYLPAKAVDGRFEEIRPCIYCCVGCLGSVLEKGAPVACSVNPMAGREIEGPVGQLEKKKKVLVLGAGPAGMQAAVTAAEKGHEVHLIERTKVLGGQMLLASVPPGKKGIELFRIYLENRLKRSAVTVEFGKRVTSELVDKIKPEVVVLAIGSDPVVPDMEGLSNKKSFTAREILTAQQVEERRILIAGGGQVGCEVAEFLAEHGKEVIIVEILDDVALDMEPINRLALIMSLEDHGVRIMTKTKVESVSDQGVLVNCLGRKKVIPVDAVVFAVGSEPRQDSVEVLIRNKVAEVYPVGDKLRARGILEAIREGFDVARLI